MDGDSNKVVPGSMGTKPPSVPPRPNFGYNQFNSKSFSLPIAQKRENTNGQNAFKTMNGNSATGYSSTELDYFTRAAVESSLGAFKTFGSVISAINSLAGVLSTTHNSILILFRTIVNAINEFSRLKSQFLVLLSPQRIFRWFKWLIKQILSLLKLKSRELGNDSEAIWFDATYLPPGCDSSTAKFLNLPVIIFWIFALAAPYVLYKFLSSLVDSIEQSKKWAKGNDEYYKAKALYNFIGQNTNEISFCSGENLRIAPIGRQPKINGWFLASNWDGENIGLVPSNYIEITERVFPSEAANLLDRNFDEIFGKII